MEFQFYQIRLGHKRNLQFPRKIRAFQASPLHHFKNFSLFKINGSMIRIDLKYLLNIDERETTEFKKKNQQLTIRNHFINNLFSSHQYC